MATMPEYLRDKNSELIWVSKEVADAYVKLTDLDEAEKLIMVTAEAVRRDMKNTIENLDDDVLMLKSKVLQYKKAFKDAVYKKTKN